MTISSSFGRALGLCMTILFLSTTTANSQYVVINEIEVFEGVDGQYVELFGDPFLDLGGLSIALVKATFLGGGVYEAQVYNVLDLTGETLNEDGFASFNLAFNTTIAAVALYEMEGSSIELDSTPPSDDIIDALVYGNTSPANPQAATILQSLMPAGSGLIYEGGEGNQGSGYKS